MKLPFFFLAEDDEDDQMLFLEALREINPGIRCMIAKNGREALLSLQNNIFELPDYIFLDLNMPVMNGLNCLAEIKKSSLLRNIPVILYSTSSAHEDSQAGKKLGASDFFLKPPDSGGLLRYLQKVLERFPL